MIQDANLDGVLKTWYTDKSPEDAFFMNSSVVKRIPKTRIGGKTYNLLLTLGNGGAASGNLVVSTANATANGSGPNAEFAVTNGQLFSTFFITQQEILQSMNLRGAYMPIAVNKFAQMLDSFRKLTAISLYGTGFGEVCNAVVLTTVVGSNTMTLANVTDVIKFSIGTVFQVTNGSSPSSTLRTSINTVTKIDNLTITFDATAVETWSATDWIEIYGCRTGSTPLLPIGLGGWLPVLAHRTGGTWNTYIGTDFFGVDRSVNVNGAAGQYVRYDATADSSKISNTVVRAINSVRIAGGVPDILVVNNEDYQTMINEMNAQTTFFQSINTGSKPNKNEVAKGISDMKYAFSTSWVDEVWPDPYCPKGRGYILQDSTLEFAAFTNAEKPLDDGIEGNNPGKQNITDVDAPAIDYSWWLDEYLTSQPAAITVYGPAVQVIAQMYGQWVVHNPSLCCVIEFT